MKFEALNSLDFLSVLSSNSIFRPFYSFALMLWLFLCKMFPLDVLRIFVLVTSPAATVQWKLVALLLTLSFVYSENIMPQQNINSNI
jgi:hypothetical protein